MPTKQPKSRKKADEDFPLSVRQGSAEVKIYSTPFSKGGQSYPQFTVAYYLGNRRVRQTFADLGTAKAEAQSAAIKIANAEQEALKLTGADRAIYVQCLGAARTVGKPLNLIVAEYTEAVALLPAGTSLKDAVREFARRSAEVRSVRTVSELVDEFVAAKEKAGMSARHMKDIRYRLGRFAKRFACPVSVITAPMIEEHLDVLGLVGRNRVNEITCLSSALRHAVRQKLAPRDLLEELSAIQRPKVEPPATLIWTPEELRELLENAPEAFVPLVTLGGLCGMRTSEIIRADWSHITPEGNHLAVITRKGRTPSRRLVPLCPAAKAWLAPHQRPTGAICSLDREDLIVRKITSALNGNRTSRGIAERFSWRENALRHSYGTYRVALTADIHRTSLEMGNSPTMITKHYLQLATKEQAEAWFGITPGLPSNVVTMPPAERPVTATAG